MQNIFAKVLLHTRQRFARPMQPTAAATRVACRPSLILHGRTEIKAGALVTGEVSALSFSVQEPAIDSAPIPNLDFDHFEAEHF